MDNVIMRIIASLFLMHKLYNCDKISSAFGGGGGVWLSKRAFCDACPTGCRDVFVNKINIGEIQ